MIGRYRMIALLSLFGAVVEGCASATVNNQTQTIDPVKAPGIVYVGSFDLGSAAIQSDPGTLTGRPRLLSIFHNQDPAEVLRKLEELLASDIVRDLNKAGLQSQRLDTTESRPTHGWLVAGEFLELQEGNRAQRAVLGFGAGSSDARLYVTLADLSHPEGQNLLSFDAQASGDKMPGGSVAAVAAHSPWGIVAKFAIERNASERDIDHAAQKISDQIVTFASGK